jgi:hypothetical protein
MVARRSWELLRDVRDQLAEQMRPTIEQHRAARARLGDPDYHSREPRSDVDYYEVIDFIATLPGLSFETLIALEEPSDPAYHGLSASTIRRVLSRARVWAFDPEWAQARWFERGPVVQPLELRQIWRPRTEQAPLWVADAPACLLLAEHLVERGKMLSAMGWRQFEELVGVLLERDGWTVEVTQPSKDGGIDVIGTRVDTSLGIIRSIWQAKKYSQRNRVRLSEVRELSAIREDAKASKALVVTTSKLTRDAIAWVRRDQFRMGYMEHDALTDWIRRAR